MGDEAAELAVPSADPAAEVEGTASDGVSYWSAVQYDVAPYRTYNFFKQFRTTASNPNNFLKGVKW